MLSFLTGYRFWVFIFYGQEDNYEWWVVKMLWYIRIQNLCCLTAVWMHYLLLRKRLEKMLDGNYTICCEQSWTRPGGNTPQSTNYTATCLPSRKLSKLDEPNMQTLLEKQGRAHKWRTLMDPHIWAEQKQDDLLEHTYCSYVRIRDVALKDLPEAINDWERVAREGSGHSHHNQVTLIVGISLTVFLSVCLYHLVLPVGFPNYIPCPHRADVKKFSLVGQHRHVHV